MTTTHRIGLPRRLKGVTSFFGLVALSALAVLLAQNLLTPSQAAAQADQTQAAPSDKAAAIVGYDTAVNNGDLEGAMAMFATNAVFVGAGRGAGGCSQIAPCTDPTGI